MKGAGMLVANFKLTSKETNLGVAQPFFDPKKRDHFKF